MSTDTTEKGLEDLIVEAMIEAPPPGARADVHERPSAYAPGWILGAARKPRAGEGSSLSLGPLLDPPPLRGRGRHRPV